MPQPNKRDSYITVAAHSSADTAKKRKKCSSAQCPRALTQQQERAHELVHIQRLAEHAFIFALLASTLKPELA